jgi:hypothetical protein
MWKDLGNPRPHAEPTKYLPLKWREGPELPFEEDLRSVRGAKLLYENSPSMASYETLALSRRTRYDFGELNLATLGTLFALTSKVLLRGSDVLGFPISNRPAPSAGAIHPIHIIIHLARSPRLHRYDPFAHGLRELHCEVDVMQLREAMNVVVNGQAAVLIMFVAEPGRTFAKYAQADSLVWRDAGILQGYFSIAAEALGVNFTPLGVTGDPWASQLIQQPGLAGVGAAFVGARP